MRLDDTPHKVYIYDLDAELSSSDSESESHMVFIPDIDKHLRTNRIPKAVLHADDKGKFAGKDVKEMQLVLFGAPKSLSVPEEKDSVRRAIIETRHRAKEEGDRVQERIKEAQRKVKETYPPAKDTLNGMGLNGMALDGMELNNIAPEPVKPVRFSPGFGPAGGFGGAVDDDAMDLDL